MHEYSTEPTPEHCLQHALQHNRHLHLQLITHPVFIARLTKHNTKTIETHTNKQGVLNWSLRLRQQLPSATEALTGARCAGPRLASPHSLSVTVAITAVHASHAGARYFLCIWLCYTPMHIMCTYSKMAILTSSSPCKAPKHASRFSFSGRLATRNLPLREWAALLRCEVRRRPPALSTTISNRTEKPLTRCSEH